MKGEGAGRGLGASACVCGSLLFEVRSFARDSYLCNFLVLVKGCLKFFSALLPNCYQISPFSSDFVRSANICCDSRKACSVVDRCCRGRINRCRRKT